MRRALLLVLDSLGVGGAPDAASYGDVGANTLASIATACAQGNADNNDRCGPLQLPNLSRLGLGAACQAASGVLPLGLTATADGGAYTAAVEQSRGKDTPSGHWELTGVPVRFDWGYFPHRVPCLPAALRQALIERGELPGLLGEKHASGTDIIDELGDCHRASGKPIVYTSADSVLQIAAHEQSFGLARLLALCELARTLCDEFELNIGRVIARPFTGTSSTNGGYQRTGNRRDYSVPPPADTLLDDLIAAGGTTLAVGKIADIFAGRGISEVFKANGNDALFDATLTALAKAGERSLVFTNFVDFDMLYGHRRDLPGYALALEAFDARLPELLAAMDDDDLAIISADHGNDPSWPGSDHTREQVPVLAFGPRVNPGPLPNCASFADVGQTLADYFGLKPLTSGKSFLDQLNA